jgi:hypothetical protein
MLHCGTILIVRIDNTFGYCLFDFINSKDSCPFGAPFSEKLNTFQSIGGATMKNQKNLALIVATIMLFSFTAVPPADAFIGMAALGAIIAATFASAVLINETAIKSNDEFIPEHSASKQNTQDNLQALNEP